MYTMFIKNTISFIKEHTNTISFYLHAYKYLVIIIRIRLVEKACFVTKFIL
jgi:hypothetical protein